MTAAMRRASRPLPGVSFEVEQVAPTPTLPRMDVAGFVGFASNGPLDTPVLVHDVARFREIFGGDVRLGDAADGYPATFSLLGPTVELFFENGGTSCWVVRVGASPTSVTYTIPGLVSGVLSDPDTWTTATAVSRAPGTGAEPIRLAASQQVTRLALGGEPVVLTDSGGSLNLPQRSRVAVGELLDLVLDDGVQVWVTVGAVSRDPELGSRTATWSLTDECWLRPTATMQIDAAVPSITVGARVEPNAKGLAVNEDGSLLVRTTSLLEQVAAGELIRFEVEGIPRISVAAGEPLAQPDGTLEVAGWPTRDIGTTLRPAVAAGAELSVPVARASILRADLHARRGGFPLASVTSLDYSPGAARWLGQLPDDAELFGRSYRGAAGSDPDAIEMWGSGVLDEAASVPRFPAAFTDATASFIPLGLESRPVRFGTALVADEPERNRNGVASLDPAVFGDTRLAGLTPGSILSVATQRFHLEFTALSGMHGLLPLEEVVTFAIPDALQPSWEDLTIAPPDVLGPPTIAADDATNSLSWTAPPAEPDAEQSWSLQFGTHPDFAAAVTTEIISENRFAASGRVFQVDNDWCGWRWYRVRETRDGVRGPWSNTAALFAGEGGFTPCDNNTPEPLVLTQTAVPASGSDAAGIRVTLTDFSFALEATASAEIQFSTEPGFESSLSTIVETDPLDAATARSIFVEHLAEARYVRARRNTDATEGLASAPWSNTIVVPPVGTRVTVAQPQTGTSAHAIDVHRSMAAMAAARQDCTALISFPASYEFDDVEDHVTRLTANSSRPGSAPGLSTWGDFVHAHHPWVARQGDPLLAVPVDGAVAGQLAATAQTRGAWIAGERQPLRGIVGLQREIPASVHEQLRGLQINGVQTLIGEQILNGVDTLSANPATRPVTVRRLLMLLRRLAIREGQQFVFENNGPRLWGLAQTRFESALIELWTRGAFAGNKQSDGFRVVCDVSVNPGSVTDRGQLAVELLVAPSFPLEYITVRLGQLGAGGFEQVDTP